MYGVYEVVVGDTFHFGFRRHAGCEEFDGGVLDVVVAGYHAQVQRRQFNLQFNKKK